MEPAPSLTRHALIPASLVVAFGLVYIAKIAPWWLAAVGGPVVLLYVLAPRIGRRSLARFDRDALPILAAGAPHRLRARYRRALGMRLFAPPALVAERRARVEAEIGRHGRARAAYRRALEGYPDDGAPLAVRLGLAHASFALGDDREAIRAYRAVLRESGSYPQLARNLAHALARRGEDLEEAEALAEQALREAGEPPPAEALLVRALVHARRGEAKPARRLLKRTRGAPSVDRLREEVETALA